MSQATNAVHVLKNHQFRLLWLGQAVSTLGDKFSEIAIPLLIFKLTGSAAQLGLAFVVQVSAALLFGLVAGALSDRWDRRRTMLNADLLRALIVLLIPLVLIMPASITIHLTLLYILNFLAAAVKQFFTPAKISAIPQLVSKEQLVQANSLDQATMQIVTFLGFSMAGAVVAFTGTTTAFLIDGGTFLLSAFFIYLLQLPARDGAGKPSSDKSLIADIRGGLEHAWQHPLLRAVVLLSLLAPLALGATQPLILVFSQRTLEVGDFGFALIEAAFGLGLALGVMLIGRFAPDAPREKLLTWGVAGIGVGLIFATLLPLSLKQLFALPAWALLTVSIVFFIVSAGANGVVFLAIRTIVQENTPGNMIGRVFSVVGVGSSIAMALGASSSGLADRFEVSYMMAMWGGFLIIAGIFLAVWIRLQSSTQMQPATA